MSRAKEARGSAGQTADVVVIGAGFGGLATALRLSELGAKVVLLETLSYPGGCASTFHRDGYGFEAGATLCSGFDPGQLFHRWIRRYGLNVELESLDPVVELRSPLGRMPVSRDREQFVAGLSLPRSVPRGAVSAFFERQQRVADVLWSFFDDEALLPPFGLRQLLEHARRAGDYARIAPLLGRTLGSVLHEHGLGGHEPLRVYLDALCQITVQCSSREAEATFALAAMDYYFRGTKHVRGGVGSLAWGLVHAIRDRGGTVRLKNGARRIAREPRGGFRVEGRMGDVTAPIVVANVLPQNLRKLAGLRAGDLSRLDRLARRVEDGWGAAMLYRVARAPTNAPATAAHLELVQDPDAPFVEGNHVFCSFGSEGDGGAPEGYRTVTVSTHVRPSVLANGSDEERTRYVTAVHGRMRETMRRLAPEWEDDLLREMTASPRTFERFTGRFSGFVGGVPRRAGLHNYRGLGPRRILPGLYLVGDSVFPGQSTLATAVGGVKLANTLAA